MIKTTIQTIALWGYGGLPIVFDPSLSSRR
jgi:hypothetical protein